MQNVVINMLEKFNYDRPRNDRALADQRYDNKTRTTFVALGDPFPDHKKNQWKDIL